MNDDNGKPEVTAPIIPVYGSMPAARDQIVRMLNLDASAGSLWQLYLTVTPGGPDPAKVAPIRRKAMVKAILAIITTACLIAAIGLIDGSIVDHAALAVLLGFSGWLTVKNGRAYHRIVKTPPADCMKPNIGVVGYKLLTIDPRSPGRLIETAFKLGNVDPHKLPAAQAALNAAIDSIQKARKAAETPTGPTPEA